MGILEVAVQAFIINGRKEVLLGKRIGSLGNGTWNCPCGHLEFGELWPECAIRETLEEAGIKIKNICFVGASNEFFKKENKHYIVISLVADFDSGEVKIMEPDKCEKWEWFNWNNLPSPLFQPIESLLKQGFNPFKKYPCSLNIGR